MSVGAGKRLWRRGESWEWDPFEEKCGAEMPAADEERKEDEDRDPPAALCWSRFSP